jgi:4-amino-4-deoxy-L-arabinose transferase-like glycosyltransferase
MKPKWITINTIIVCALFLRVFFFAGFVLGDDPAYADNALMITQGHYPPLCDVCVFAFRPLVLFPVALSLKYLGWSEFTFVFPILLASLISIYLIFALGTVLFDRTTGLVAASLLTVFPLNLVHATTMSNDIMLSMVVALALLLFLKGLEERKRKSIFLCIVAGAVLGSAAGIKINALPIVALFAIIALYRWWERKTGRTAVLAFVLSWLFVQGVFLLICYMGTGDALAPIHAEMNFNKNFNPSGFVNSPEGLQYALLYYPQFMLGTVTEGHPGYSFYPYGFFYPVFLIALLYFFCTRERKIIIPLFWFSFLFLMMEFAPLRIAPYYQPIHRLVRFLSIVSIPSLLVIAYFMKRVSERGGISKGIMVLLALGLVTTSLHQAYKKSYCYGDCLADGREAHAVMRTVRYRQVITDQEMKNSLLFFNRFKGRHKIKSFEHDKPQFLPGSVVILGGARRPDVSPDYIMRFAATVIPQKHWKVIYEGKKKGAPWRKRDLIIYKIMRKR